MRIAIIRQWKEKRREGKRESVCGYGKREEMVQYTVARYISLIREWGNYMALPTNQVSHMPLPSIPLQY